MNIKSIVLHQIIKERNDKPNLNCSKKLLPINSKINEFVLTLIKSYNSKNPTQGTFESDINNYPFQEKCKNYLLNHDFLKFSTEAMEILKKEINTSTTTGGYVVFIHYEEKTFEFLITAMLDKSTQFTVDDENLGIEKLMTLDVEKLARANRLNINRWVNQDILYLSFIKGTRDISKYFLNFIGSTDVTSSKENFKKLKNAVTGFTKSNNYSLTKKDKIREAISIYIAKCFEKKEDVEIESISSIIDNEHPNRFLEYLQQNQIEVSGKISIHRKTDYETFIRTKVIEDGYTLVFDKALIKNKKITKQNNNIIIHNVNENILNQAFENE